MHEEGKQSVKELLKSGVGTDKIELPDGSARWGGEKDIEPYVDPEFANNVILTRTERLTMESRPKEPKYARNKNVLVVGGSGSGRTRFFIKPNLLQMHSSYVVTAPKGYLWIGQCERLSGDDELQGESNSITNHPHLSR